MASTPDHPSKPGGLAATPAGTLLGGFADYSIGDVAGQGLAGPIRAARYLPSGLDVHIEEIPPELSADPGFRSRLVAAGQSASRLRDPSAVAVYDLLAGPQRVALVTERIDGRPLPDLAGGSALPAAAALSVTDAALSALTAAHADGIVHAAVSPQAMWVTSDGRARLGGFAVGRALHPEVDAEPVVDTAAVAVMAAALLGVPLEAGAGASDKLRRIRTVLRRAVSPDRRRRYRTASGMRAALTAAAADALGNAWRDDAASGLAALAASAPAAEPLPQPAPPEARRPRRARRVLTGAGLVAGAVAAGLLIGFVVAVIRGTGPAASAGLTVDPPLALQVDPPQGSCDTTFAITVTGAVEGRGTLLYRWERSDGLQTQDTQLAIPASNSSFRITERWEIAGPQSQPTITFRLLSPGPMSISQALPYSCP